MSEKECAINIIKTILSNESTPDSFHDLYEIGSDNKKILLGHITALKNIFTKAEKQLKKEINEVNMKYIASCSFGKDSLAMLIKIKELGMPLDEVIYCDIRFDDNISGEMPKMAEFIPKAEKILKDKFDITVKHITYKRTFKEQFYTKKERGKHIGDYYGFPYVIGAWCNSRLKIEPIRNYLKSIDDDVIQYVGIAYDEPKRYERLNHDTHIAPLYDLKITEKEAIEICKKYDLLSPIYDDSFRGGCWFCPKQRLSQLRFLYKNYPNLWKILKDMEKDSHNTFRPNTTLIDLEERFKNEIEKR